MNNKTQEALRMAIDTMEMHVPYYVKDRGCDAINACKEALEQPAQEPVGVVSWHEGTVMGSIFPSSNMPKDGVKLYTHPYQWQGLTDDEISKLWCTDHASYLEFANSIEQALKDKNHE